MTDLRVGHFLLWKRSDNVVQKKLPSINSAHGSETRNIINELIKLFNGMGYTYDESLRKAHSVLDEAKKTNIMNKDVQAQVNKFISEFESTGETNLEIVQARGDFDVLAERVSNLTKIQEFKSELNTPKSITVSANGANRRPFATFVDDDGFSQAYDKLIPIYEARDLKTCYAIITGTVDTNGRVTKEQLVEMQNNGHEILSHTHDHLPFGDMTPDEIEHQCKLSKEILMSWGLKADSIIYPFGQYGGADGIERIKKYYKSGWAANSFAGNEVHTDLEDSFTPYRINTKSTLAHMKAQVDKAISQNAWIVFMTHANTETAADLKRIEDICDYIISKNVEVGTIEEGLQIFGNTFDIGSKKTIKVLAGGDIVGNGIGSVFKSRFEGYDISDQTIPNEFESEKITYSIFRHTDQEYANFPESHNGVLETFVSFAEGTQSYQIWKPLRSQNEYRRGVSGTIMQPWQDKWRTSGLVIRHEMTDDTEYEDLPSHFTLSRVSSAQGYPASGTLVTFKPSDDSSFGKQMFFPINKNEMRYRTFYPDGTKSEFKTVPNIKSKTFLTPRLDIEVGENRKTIDIDITDWVGSTAATNRLSYALSAVSGGMDNVIYNSRISLGILKIHVIDVNKDNRTIVPATDFKITIFE